MSTDHNEEYRAAAHEAALERMTRKFVDDVGGDEVWSAMNDYAEGNWSEEKIDRFNQVARSGDPRQIRRAVDVLRAEFSDATFGTTRQERV